MILQNPNILSRIKYICTLIAILFAFSLKNHQQKYYSKKLRIMLTTKSHFPLEWYKAPFNGKLQCDFVYNRQQVPMQYPTQFLFCSFPLN